MILNLTKSKAIIHTRRGIAASLSSNFQFSSSLENLHVSVNDTEVGIILWSSVTFMDRFVAAAAIVSKDSIISPASQAIF